MWKKKIDNHEAWDIKKKKRQSFIAEDLTFSVKEQQPRAKHEKHSTWRARRKKTEKQILATNPDSKNKEKKDQEKSINETVEWEQDVKCLQLSILRSDSYIADRGVCERKEQDAEAGAEEGCGWHVIVYNRKKGKENEEVMK